jgi:hypothetical protein
MRGEVADIGDVELPIDVTAVGTSVVRRGGVRIAVGPGCSARISLFDEP